MTEPQFKSGYVSIIGEPNVGKSTLLNAMLGEKLAIVTPKPQTTRNQIRGIVTSDDYQIIFLDTPGILRPKYQLHNWMVKAAYAALQESGKAPELRCVSAFPSQCGHLGHGGSAKINFSGECVTDRSSQMPSAWRFILGLSMDLNLAEVAALELLPRIGKTRAQAIVMYRRENGPFNTIEDLEDISGIGPKTAIVLLSAVSPDEFKRRLIAGEVSMLTALPGIGPKTARRIIVELKDKFVKLSSDDLPKEESDALPEVNDAYDALLALGFQIKDIRNAISTIQSKDKKMGTEEIIKQALTELR